MPSNKLKRFFSVSRIWMILFLALFTGSYFLGFMPTGAKEAFWAFIRPSDSNSTILLSVPIRRAGAPVSETWTAPRIIIPKISVASAVVFPTSSDLDILNATLLKGVVRYPGTSMPGETGNILLFGHSTTLQARNPAYKVFNRVKELKPGDAILLHSDTREYLYAVKSVEIKEADDAKIDLTSDSKLLTLSTCNIIGGKESRYVVTAEFVKSYPLAK